MDNSKEIMDTEDRELRVLDYELKNLGEDRKMYLQQPNSNIFFLCKKADALSHLTKRREILQNKQKSTTTMTSAS